MKVHHRCGLLVVVLLLGFLAALFLNYRNEEQVSASLLNSLLESKERQIDALMTMEGRQLEAFAEDHSWKDGAVTFIADRSYTDWKDQLAGVPEIHGIDEAWIFDLDFRPLALVNQAGVESVPQIPFFRSALKEAVAREVFCHFFAEHNEMLWEFRVAPIQPSSDLKRVQAPKGYLVAGRRWDSRQIESVARLLGSEVSLMHANSGSAGTHHAANGTFHLSYPLTDQRGLPLATLQVREANPLVQGMARQLRTNQQLLLIALGSSALLVVLGSFLWVGRPLRKVTEALSESTIQPIKSMLKLKSELGEIARSVQKTLEQREELEREVKKRGDSERQAAAREQFLNRVLQNLHGIVLAINPSGNLLLAEGRDLVGFGLDKERDEGRSIFRIFRGQIERLKVFQRALDGDRFSHEFELEEHTFLSLYEPILREDGGLELLVVLALDITDKKRVEDALTKAKLEAERTGRLKSQFLSVMSHETRTPLNGVLGFARILKETDLNPDQLEYLERIMESGNNLLKLLTDIIELTRLESGEALLEIQSFSLELLIFQIAEKYKQMAYYKGLEFKTDFGLNLPDFVLGDMDKLTQVLERLLDNAIKFTDRGRVSFTVLRGLNREGHEGVRFLIQDTGPGIPDSLAREVFEPFVQADASSTRKHGGVGLGLSIGLRLARKMGGELSLQSSAEEGSTLNFFVPLEESPGGQGSSRSVRGMKQIEPDAPADPSEFRSRKTRDS